MLSTDLGYGITAPLTAAGTIVLNPAILPLTANVLTSISSFKNWTFILNGSNIQTANLSLSIDIWDPTTLTYITPANIFGSANPFTITFGTGANGTITLVTGTGLLLAARINIASFGTSTGTFRGTILAS